MTTPFRGRSEDADQADLDVREFLAVLARRKWLILAVTVLTVALTAAYSYTRDPVYVAQAQVLVRPTLVGPFETNPGNQISMETEIELATSSPVATLAAKASGVEGGELLDGASVRAPENARVLEISFADEDPARAARGAQALADAYLRFRSRQALQTIERQAASLGNEIQELDRQVAALNRELRGAGASSAEARDLADRRDALNAARLALQNQLATVTTLTTDPGQVVRAADPPTSPSSPNRKLNFAVGAIAGVLLGVALVSLRDRLTNRIETSADLEDALDAPTLAIVPNVRFRRRSHGLAMLEDPNGSAAEAYRALRAKVVALSRQSSTKTLLVTSAEAGEGKTTTAANLAVALAQAGKRVVLISGDFRRPRLHVLFGVGNRHGLGEVLAGAVPLEEAVTHTSLPRLKLLTSSSPTALETSVDLLESERMRTVLEQCDKEDFVVIDGPPIAAVADALGLAEHADSVLFVVNVRKATQASVMRARQHLHQVGARVLGGVANRVRARRSADYDSYYYPRSRPSSRSRRLQANGDRAVIDTAAGAFK